jgi:hypothetical protein
LIVVEGFTRYEEQMYTIRLSVLPHLLLFGFLLPRLRILVVDQDEIIVIHDDPLLWIRFGAVNVYAQPVSRIPSLDDILHFLESARLIGGRHCGWLRFLRLRRHEFCDCRELRSRVGLSDGSVERTGVGSFLRCGVYCGFHFVRWLSARDFLGGDCIVNWLPFKGVVAFVHWSHCRSLVTHIRTEACEKSFSRKTRPGFLRAQENEYEV